MSVITKLENSYLAILRFVVIVGAGLLLIASVVLAAGSFELLKAAPVEDKTPSTVDVSAVVEQLAGKSKPGKKSAEGKPVEQKDAAQNVDEKMAKLAKLVDAFVSKHSAGRESVDQKLVVRFINQIAQKSAPEDLTPFLSGLELVLEKAFVDPLVIRMASALPQQASAEETIEGSAINVSVELIRAYGVLFNNAQEAKREKEVERIAKAQESKAEAKMRATFAISAFGAFLLVVFLSIIVKIERNLRPSLPPAL